MEVQIEVARHRVRAFQGRYGEIADYVGVSKRWVNKFAQGKLTEPGAVKFAKLSEWLDARET